MAKGHRKAAQAEGIQLKNLAIGFPIFAGVAMLVFNGQPSDAEAVDPDIKTVVINLDEPALSRSRTEQNVQIVESLRERAAEETPAPKVAEEKHLPTIEVEAPTVAGKPVETQRPAVASTPAPPKNQNQNTDIVARYTMNGESFSLRYDVDAAFTEASGLSGIPKIAYVAVCARESSCKPETINTQGNCGLFQFGTDEETRTLHQMLFLHGAKHGYAEETRLVTRTDTANDMEKIKAGKAKWKDPVYEYNPASTAASEKLRTLCQNPRFNALMWNEFMAPRIKSYKAEVIGAAPRQITAGEVAGLNNFGDVMNELFIQVLHDKATGTNTLTKDFFATHRVALGGPIEAKSMLKNEDGTDKNVRRLYADIQAFGNFLELTPGS
jgi:hypothetical protein